MGACIKINVKYTRVRTELAQIYGPVAGSYSGLLKSCEFLEELLHYQLFMQDPAPWSRFAFRLPFLLFRVKFPASGDIFISVPVRTPWVTCPPFSTRQFFLHSHKKRTASALDKLLLSACLHFFLGGNLGFLLWGSTSDWMKRHGQVLRSLTSYSGGSGFDYKFDGSLPETRRMFNIVTSRYLWHPDDSNVFRPSMMRWSGHVARLGEMRNAYKILVRKAEGERPLGRPRCKWGGGGYC
jgi:hypothetical protein